MAWREQGTRLSGPSNSREPTTRTEVSLDSFQQHSSPPRLNCQLRLELSTLMASCNCSRTEPSQTISRVPQKVLMLLTCSRSWDSPELCISPSFTKCTRSCNMLAYLRWQWSWLTYRTRKCHNSRGQLTTKR